MAKGNFRKLRQNVLMGNGESYTLCVGVVREEMIDGTPRKIELIGMNEKIDFRDPRNRKLVTCYLPRQVMRTPMATIDKDGKIK